MKPLAQIQRQVPGQKKPIKGVQDWSRCLTEIIAEVNQQRYRREGMATPKYDGENMNKPTVLSR